MFFYVAVIFHAICHVHLSSTPHIHSDLVTAQGVTGMRSGMSDEYIGR